jgi:hypothetical protein
VCHSRPKVALKRDDGESFTGELYDSGLQLVLNLYGE